MSPAPIFELLLRLAPRSARERFAAGMRFGWTSDLSAARSRGLLAVLAFWIVTIVDAFRFAIAERARGLSIRRSLAVDWRDAWRSLRTAPLVSIFAVLSLALGIGGATALFSILNSLALKPLPVRDPHSLVLLDKGSWSNPIWEAIRERQSDVAAGAFAWANQRFNIAPSGAADIVPGLWVSGSLFDVLGVPAQLGRTLTVADDVRGGGPGGPAAVVSDGFWKRRFGGAPDVLGRTIVIERVPFTVVGVAPAGFLGPDVGRAFDIAIPLGTEVLVRGGKSVLDQRSAWWMNIMARLRPGQTVDDATSRLRAIQPYIRDATLPPFADAAKEYLSGPLSFIPAPGGRSVFRSRYERPLTIVLAVVGVVLLIACANVANLLIARASARRHELTVRLAIGASRWRIGRQLLAESAMLGAAGAALGMVVARWGSQLLVAQLSSAAWTVNLDLTLDVRVMAFTTAICVAAVLLFGSAPALLVTRLAPSEVLRGHGRGQLLDRRAMFRHGSVVLQVALSLALVVAASLFTRTLVQLVSRDAGFDRRGVLLVDVDLARKPSGGPQLSDVFDRLARAAAVPGVASAAASFTTPVSTSGWNTGIVVPPDSPLTRQQRSSWVNAVSPGWFETLGLRLFAGRDFTDADRAGAPQVAVVNRAFERRFFSGKPAIGESVRRASPGASGSYQIVGVVQDSVYRSLRAPMEPTIYLPLAQATHEMGPSVILSLRSGGAPPRALVKSVAASLEKEEPAAILNFQTLDEQVQGSLTQERLVATLAGFFGGLGLLLAAIGLYGVTSHAVTSRRAEIGIRMALGATIQGVIRTVVTRVARLVALGIVAGMALSIWAATYVRTLLYDLQPRDPMTLAGASVALAAVAAVAAWLPARRAARIDPGEVLRQ